MWGKIKFKQINFWGLSLCIDTTFTYQFDIQNYQTTQTWYFIDFLSLSSFSGEKAKSAYLLSLAKHT